MDGESRRQPKPEPAGTAAEAARPFVNLEGAPRRSSQHQQQRQPQQRA